MDIVGRLGEHCQQSKMTLPGGQKDVVRRAREHCIVSSVGGNFQESKWTLSEGQEDVAFF